MDVFVCQRCGQIVPVADAERHYETDLFNKLIKETKPDALDDASNQWAEFGRAMEGER